MGTEPPLRSSSNEGHQELLGSALDRSTIAHRCVDEGEKGFDTLDKVSLKDQAAVATLPDHHQEWGEQFPYAHTFAVTELSDILGVDLQ